MVNIDPPGKNTFCGPYVLAAVTGKTTDEISAMVRNMYGRSMIKKMYPRELHAVLKVCKVDYAHRRFHPPCTWTFWLGYHRVPSRTYIVFVTGHYVLVHNGRVYDHKSGMKGFGLNYYSRKRVIEVWEIPQ